MHESVDSIILYLPHDDLSTDHRERDRSYNDIPGDEIGSLKASTINCELTFYTWLIPLCDFYP